MMLFKTVLVATFMLPGMVYAKSDVFSPIKSLAEVTSGIIYGMKQPAVEDEQLFSGKKIAILAGHGVQESELKFPYEYLKARGAMVDIVSPEWVGDRLVIVQYLKPTLWVDVNLNFKQAQSSTYDLVVITGGAWNSAVVRGDNEALKLINDHYNSGSAVAAICSGSQVLIDAGLVAGRTITGTKSIKTDLENAGGNYLDVPVVVSDRIITSRNPYDLLQFVDALKNELLRNK